MSRALGLAVALTAALATAPTAVADPQPWPNIRFFAAAEAAAFTVAGADGVWFRAPGGQNCGIWGPGSFGCAGDIPGAPPGTAALGWVAGDRAVHYDWTVPWRMPQTPAQAPLPPRQLLTHRGSSCAVTDDGHTYCERGPLRFLLSPVGSRLSPPWLDLARR